MTMSPEMDPMNPEELARLGWEAFHQGRFDEALRQFAVLSVVHPERPEGYNGAGQTLRQSGRLDAAERILSRAGQQFPDHEQLAIAHGWTAVSQARWPAALERFSAVLARHPHSVGAWHGMGVSLFESGRHQEADDLLASRPLPVGAFGSSILRLLARIAVLTGRHALAAERWRALIDREPHEPRHHTALVDALRASGQRAAMEDAIRDALARFGDDLPLMLSLALSAQEVEDWNAALLRWEAVKTLFPSVADGYMGCTIALRAMDRPEDAELVIGPALRLFPEHAGLLRLAAEVAVEARKWTEAERRWHALQALQPDQPGAYLGEVEAMLTFGQGTSAEALSLALMSRFPQDPWVATQHAQVAAARQDLEVALARWRSLVERFPQAPHAWVGLIECLADIDQREEAETLSQSVFERMGEHLEVATAHARLPMRWHQWDKSERRWQALLARAPQHVPALVGYAVLLNTVEEHAAAVRLLQAAQVAPSARLALDLELARMAIQVRDWPEAFRLLVELKTRRPWNRGVKSLVAEALWQARQDAGVDGDAVPVIPELLLRTDDDEARERQANRKLLIRFESLGDSCEFGMVQRRFGAEPLSLLRWTGTPPEGLARALACRLEGVGDPEFTELQVSPQGSEYTMLDRRFEMFSHTFTPSYSQPFEAFHAAHCRRMKFMRNKLLDDFANSEKIFVYGSAKLDDENMAQLHMAARSLGTDVVLLCVRLADEAHPAGTVRLVVPGLLLGAITAFSTVNIALDEWLQVCRQALVLAGRSTEA